MMPLPKPLKKKGGDQHPVFFTLTRDRDTHRNSTGRFSSAVEDARPQIPPIPIPKMERSARNWLKVFVKPGK
jgi:hypothetical protein